jgi:hypothetical protein
MTLTIWELTERTCKWPLSPNPYVPVEDFRYCGEPTRSGKSYCDEHHKMASYRPLPPGRQERPSRHVMSRVQHKQLERAIDDACRSIVKRIKK